MSAPYALFLRLDERPVLVVGGGPVALDKARELARHGARVRVVAPSVVASLETLAHDVARRPFAASDVDGAWLVVAAATPEVNREVRAAADARRVFVVAVDDVASCTAFGAARIERGGVAIALSSGGAAPALIALLRRAIEELLPDDVGAWRAVAERARAAWKADGVPFADRRPLLLQALSAMYERDARELGATP